MAIKKTIGIVTVIALILLAAYSRAITGLYSHRHLTIPHGKYSETLAGEYEVVDKPPYHTPDVFHTDRVTLRDDGSGRMTIVSGSGNPLSLDQGSNGLYFSQNFRPSGPWLLPGIARNWNEGRIYKSKGQVFIEGYMLEKGLALFILPFKDVYAWKIELRSVPDGTDN